MIIRYLTNEHPPAISVENMEVLEDYGAVMKMIINFRSITREKFLDELLLFLKGLEGGDFELIRKYENARRVMLAQLTDDTFDELRNKYYKEWEQWRDVIQERLDAKLKKEKAHADAAMAAMGAKKAAAKAVEKAARQAAREKEAAANPDAGGSGLLGESDTDDSENEDEDVAYVPPEPTKREVYDHGTKALRLQEVTASLAEVEVERRLNDFEHQNWQRTVYDVLRHYIPGPAVDHIDGYRTCGFADACVLCIRLPEQDFDLEDDEVLRETSMLEMQTVVTTIHQMADHFDVTVSEHLHQNQDTLMMLVFDADSSAFCAKRAMTAAVALRDCFWMLKEQPSIGIVSGRVYTALAGNGQQIRCALCVTGTALSDAAALITHADTVPTELGGILCDEQTRNAALACAAAVPADPAAPWTMPYKYETFGRVLIPPQSAAGRRMRTFIPLRPAESDRHYLLRWPHNPFFPDCPTVPRPVPGGAAQATAQAAAHGKLLGRASEIEAVTSWVVEHSSGTVVIDGEPGIGKTSLLAGLYNHSPCSKCRLPSSMMALITSGCG